MKLGPLLHFLLNGSYMGTHLQCQPIVGEYLLTQNWLEENRILKKGEFAE